MDTTTADLVRRASAGDRGAFDALVHLYQRPAAAVANRYLGNAHDALEVTQEAFLKAYNSLATLQKPEAFAGWFMRIVANLALNYRRGRNTRKTAALDEGVASGESNPMASGGIRSDWSIQSAQPSRALESRELGDRLAAAMEQLPEKQRMALILFTVEQMPQKEVAEALQCSVEAVKWHVFQGRKRLKEMLKDVI